MTGMEVRVRCKASSVTPQATYAWEVKCHGDVDSGDAGCKRTRRKWARAPELGAKGVSVHVYVLGAKGRVPTAHVIEARGKREHETEHHQHCQQATTVESKGSGVGVGDAQGKAWMTSCKRHAFPAVCMRHSKGDASVHSARVLRTDGDQGALQSNHAANGHLLPLG